MKQNWKEKIGAYLHESGRRPFGISFSGMIPDAEVSDEGLFRQASAEASSILKLGIPDLNEVMEKGKVTLTHPLSSTAPLVIPVTPGENLQDEIKEALLQLASSASCSEGLFASLFFELPRILKLRNTGRIGALWDMIAADPAIPDVSIWNQISLTSAIYSSELADPDRRCSMVVYSLTPVQGFISKSRKLRDYWTASVLLSYLAFIGITKVMDELGPDHILYPSIRDQSLIEAYIRRKHGIRALNDDHTMSKLLENTSSIASFPNKFVFLAPHKEVESIVKAIRAVIDSEWERVGALVAAYLGIVETCNWRSDVEGYWNHSWASSDLVHLSDSKELGVFLRPDEYESECMESGEIAPAGYDPVLYGSTHSLIQTVLAAGKLHPETNDSKGIEGMVCPQCGEHEILHGPIDYDNISLRKYRESVDSYWNTIDTNLLKGNIKEGEKLCFICLIKRFLPLVMRSKEDEILHSVFSGALSFPSTARISYAQAFASGRISKAEYDRVSNEDLPEEADVDSRDSYYCLLIMDGDRMGDLANGASVGASWNDVLHPDIRSDFSRRFSFLSEKRLVDPSLHAAISDALNHFARFSVTGLIKDYGGEGRLIYAGGDDVAAVVPIESGTSNVIELADMIQKRYRAGFMATDGGKVSEISSQYMPSFPEKIYMGLGKSRNISISAGIMIVHSKYPLSSAIAEAHSLLNGTAKDKAGRNACAVRLSKRSGGSRGFYFNWDARNIFDTEKTYLESFNRVLAAADQGILSSSLLYSFELMEHIYQPLLGQKDLLLNAIRYEVRHRAAENSTAYIKDLAGILFTEDADGRITFQPAASIIAGFIAKGASNE